jgi:hypothetical protein
MDRIADSEAAGIPSPETAGGTAVAVSEGWRRASLGMKTAADAGGTASAMAGFLTGSAGEAGRAVFDALVSDAYGASAQAAHRANSGTTKATEI